jgi:hypothetical protein
MQITASGSGFIYAGLPGVRQEQFKEEINLPIAIGKKEIRKGLYQTIDRASARSV